MAPRRLLLELLSFGKDEAVSHDRYFVFRMTGLPYIGYLPEKDGAPDTSDDSNPMVWLLPDRRIGDRESRVNVTGKTSKMTPDEVERAELLAKLGLLTKSTSKTTYKDIEFKYRGSRQGTPAAQWKSPADVPDEETSYLRKSGVVLGQWALIDTIKKTVDLDISFLEYMTRRPGLNNREATYVIPSGDVSFTENILELQKTLRHILKNDSRVTPEFRILGDEKYRKDTIGSVIARPRETDVAFGHVKQQTLKAYHGTSSVRWSVIEKKGLIPGRAGDTYVDLVPGYSEKNIYLTLSPRDAENYATRQTLKDGGRAVILEIAVPDLSRLMPDEDSIGQMTLSRTYNIKQTPTLQYARGSWDRMLEPRDPKQITQASFGEVMRMLAVKNSKYEDDTESKRFVFDDEYKAMLAEIERQFPVWLKRGLAKAGTFAYRGWIPPQYIRKFMEYKKARYPGESKLRFPEYQRIRKEVQQTAKRFDESLFRHDMRQDPKVTIGGDFVFDISRNETLFHFVDYCHRALGLEDNYTCYFVKSREDNGIKTTGRCVPQTKEMWIVAGGRAFIDVLRTTAHELSHMSIFEQGRNEANSLHFSSNIEDEANMLAGELVNAYCEVVGHDKIYGDRRLAYS